MSLSVEEPSNCFFSGAVRPAKLVAAGFSLSPVTSGVESAALKITPMRSIRITNPRISAIARAIWPIEISESN